MTRGFKNFLGIVLACIALSALFSSPVGFFDVVRRDVHYRRYIVT